MTLASDFAGLPSHAHQPAPGRDFSRYRIVPARYPGRIIGTVFAGVVIFAILNSVLSNPRWGWDVFAEWFFAEPVLVGLGRTLL
ncbi:ABC transporter ATP-binding protein, partial [Bosea sp. TAB14]